MMTRRTASLACAAAIGGFAADNKAERKEPVRILRVPGGGLQPQAGIDERGTLHVVYYAGDAHAGDLFYVRSSDRGSTFSPPIRVNSQPGSAIAAGTIRGAQLAIGKSNGVHIAWNGSEQAEPKGPMNPDSGKPGAPMLYSRLSDTGSHFEPQRNLMHRSFGLDGGGSVAADLAGNVDVAWHGIGMGEAAATGKEGEARRQVWLARSEDGGRSFPVEEKAWSRATGVCGCCGMKILADRTGHISALYRSATESVHRDIYLLWSNDRGRTFDGQLLHKWDVNACPMSSMDAAENGKETVAAWETGGQVYWVRLDPQGGAAGKPASAPGDGRGRKHPRIAINGNGEVLLAWTEGTGWQKGGSLAWQVYDGAGQARGVKKQLPGIPAWSFAAAIAHPDNTFSIIY
jgi:hypothetical protein